MSDIQEARNAIILSLEHAEGAQALAPGLRDLQTEAVGFGEATQSKLETAIKGLEEFVGNVVMASDQSSSALNDTEKIIHTYTHEKATSTRSMSEVKDWSYDVASKLFVANDRRKEAIKGSAGAISSFEAALTCFDLFRGKLDDALDWIQGQDGIGSKVQKARTPVLEILPKSEGLTGVGGYLTTLKEANRTNEQQLQHLRVAEGQVPSEDQLITGTMDRIKRSLKLLESAEDKTIKEFAETLVKARAEVTLEDIHLLKDLANSIEKGVSNVEKSGAESVGFQAIIKDAAERGRQILRVV